MTQPHGERDHATWSASSTSRNWACPGALTLADEAPPDKESPAAAWGTACHEVAEKWLRDPKLLDGSVFLGMIVKTKEHEVTVDEEMIETAQVYVEHVRKRVASDPNAQLWIEEKFSLDALDPPFDAGGTGDAVMYLPAALEIEVDDLKGGKGVVVEVQGNPQMRSYALGAMLKHPKLAVEKITVTIVQPRAPHKDGRIRSETFHAADLIEWTGDLVAAMKVAANAKEQFKAMPRAAWAKAFLNAGDHCKFCRAAGFCPALEQRALDAAGVWFDDLDAPRISNQPQQMDGDALAKKLDLLDMIEEWIKALRAFAHNQAENGVTIPGYQLVEKIGNRKWASENTAYDFLRKSFDLDQITVSKMISPAQAEKLLGASRKAEIADFVIREKTGVNLVKTSKTSRPAAPAAAQRFFQPE